MKKVLWVLLAVFALTGCERESLLPQENISDDHTQTITEAYEEPAEEKYPEGPLLELPGRVYPVEWENENISVFLMTEEEYNQVVSVVMDIMEKLKTDDWVYQDAEILAVSYDPIRTGRLVSPENREETQIYKSDWADENYYAHYAEFDVLVRLPAIESYGEETVQVVQLSLYREDASEMTGVRGWRTRQIIRRFLDLEPYVDETGTADDYRPLSDAELDSLTSLINEDIIFGVMLLRQEPQVCWVYTYDSETDTVNRHVMTENPFA